MKRALELLRMQGFTRPVRALVLLVATLYATPLRAQGVAADASAGTPGYLERVVQWTVQRGERCSDVASALYADAARTDLVQRYSAVDCNNPLPEGATLVLPESVAPPPVALLRAMHPDVKARPPGGEWTPAATGMRFFRNHLVNTLDGARADISFGDRTRIFLSERTLVVIYGSAAQTAATRSPTVQLDEGELMAGIAALHGKPLTVASSGGEIRGNSRDVVVRRKRERSAVSVFDGTVQVSGQGKAVNVDAGQGTTLVVNAPPTPPRPLPPAPELGRDTTREVAWSLDAEGAILTTWRPVSGAVAYRVELARDAEFADLLARVEVPAEVNAFRAEKLPVGSYHVRVRVIDSEDFLGLAAARQVHVVALQSVGSPIELGADGLRVDRYGKLVIATPAGVQLAVAGAAPRVCPCPVELAAAPATLDFVLTSSSKESQALAQLAIRQRPVRADILAELRSDVTNLRVEFVGVGDESLKQWVAPKLRIVRAQGTSELSLAPLHGVAQVQLASRDLAPRARVEVVDSSGWVMGYLEAAPPPANVQGAVARRSDAPVGATAPFYPTSPGLDAAPFVFVPRSSGALTLAASSQGEGAQLLTRLGLQHAFGRVAVHGGLSSPALAGAQKNAADAGFIGVSVAAYRPSDSFRFGPALRLGIPLQWADPWRPEIALGLERRSAPWGVASNVGVRAAVGAAPDSKQEARVREELHASVQTSLDVGEQALLYGLLDLHAALGPTAQARGGFTLGAEYGAAVFGGAAIRLSPWDSAGGVVSGQFALGVRAP